MPQMPKVVDASGHDDADAAAGVHRHERRPCARQPERQGPQDHRRRGAALWARHGRRARRRQPRYRRRVRRSHAPGRPRAAGLRARGGHRPHPGGGRRPSEPRPRFSADPRSPARPGRDQCERYDRRHRYSQCRFRIAPRTRAQFEVKLDAKGMQVDGTANLGGIASAVSWQENFDSVPGDDNVRSAATCSTRCCRQCAASAGRRSTRHAVCMPPYIDGPVPAHVVYVVQARPHRDVVDDHRRSFHRVRAMAIPGAGLAQGRGRTAASGVDDGDIRQTIIWAPCRRSMSLRAIRAQAPRCFLRAR